MSNKSILDYARSAALAEHRILELLDSALHDDLDDRSEAHLRSSAPPHQGQDSSG